MEAASIIIVGIGCWGERWSEHHEFSVKSEILMPDEYALKIQHRIRKKYERIFWLMVVWGLALELIAFGFAFRASNNEILELQAKLQPRSITDKQINDFIFLTEKISKKIPIKIHASSDGDDTYGFSQYLRFMFDKAGFRRDSSLNGVEVDADISRYIHIFRGRDGTNGTVEWPSVFISAHDTNDLAVTEKEMPKEITNGFFRPIVTEQNAMKVYVAIGDCLEQIGEKRMWITNSFLLSKGECEILVPQK